MVEEEHNRLLSASHTEDDDDDDDVKGISYKSASADVASSIKDIHINENPQSKTTSLFHRSLSSSKSHRRVVRQDSDSDDDDIGPPVPSKNSSRPQPSTDAGKNSDDDEIGPPVPDAGSLLNIRQGDSVESSDEEIGPPLPAVVASESKQEDKDLENEKISDDDDDDDDDDDSEVIVISVFKMLKCIKCLSCCIDYMKMLI